MERYYHWLFKYAFGLNVLLFALGAAGYLLLFPGAVIHVLLGGVQVLLFLHAIIKFKDYSKRIQRQLVIYAIPCTAVLINFFLTAGHQTVIFTVLASIPLAIFFIIILKQLQTHYHGIEES
ncbi:hypothetical protein [Gilvibacter sediminis]|uniref:hypothetical protein n=1 Tax=Gilvibacter sediminis TaxID=379071 RepID=UPI0023506174|nr:hypothetical protein [Gilvibacter sediminis]MDC7997593.1 hypothetical protein [Gilvibacter sediminis]